MFGYRVTYNPLFSHDNLYEDGRKWIAGRVQAENHTAACEKLFEMFNSGLQPEGYRSMSVGDFVTLTEDESQTTYVCANTGWQAIPESEMVR